MRMDDIPKLVFLFLVFFAAANAELICGDGLDENSRDFIREQIKESTETFKSEMEYFSGNLEESFNQKILLSHGKLLLEIQKLSEKIDVNQNKLTQLENLMANLPDLLKTRPSNSVESISPEVSIQSEEIFVVDDEFFTPQQNFSMPIDQNATTEISAVNSTVINESEIISTTDQPTPQEVRSRVIVEEVASDSGIIEFDGGANSEVKRKIWMLQHDETNFISDARFLMEENNLGEGAHLTIWSDFGHFHLYNGSQGNWREERRAYGHLILVTLTIGNSSSAGDTPKFKLRFTVTRSSSVFNFYSSEVAKDAGGVTTISFPKGNGQNYSPLSLFYAVVAPSDGRRFALRLKQIDVPNRPGDCKGFLQVWFLKETPTDTKYEKQPKSVVRECGQAGNISELIGEASVAVVEFYSSSSGPTGRGFRLEADISGAAE